MTLAKVRNLPESHPYVTSELGEIREQLEFEQRLVGGSSIMDLQREMWTIRGSFP